MDKADIQKSLGELRKNSKKRKFSQSVELIINLKDIDVKKTDQQLDLFVNLPNNYGRKVKVGAFVAAELAAQSKEACSMTVTNDQFDRYTDKKKIKNLADSCDYFIAQATIMPEIAKRFGSVLGPKKKMPNPKAGCVAPPNANLKLLIEKLQKTVRVTAKVEPVVKLRVGAESMDDKELTENIHAVYNAVLHAVPNEKNNIQSALVKFTMSKPVAIKI